MASWWRRWKVWVVAALLAAFTVWVALTPLIYQYVASLVPNFRDVIIAFALKFWWPF